MTSIRAVTSSPAIAYTPSRAASDSGANRPTTPLAEPATREEELTRQLDTRLTEKLNHIRQQISPNGKTSPTNGPRQVNILA